MKPSTAQTPPTPPQKAPNPSRSASGRALEIDMTGLPLILDRNAIDRVTGGIFSPKTIDRMLRSQEIPSFILRSRRVCRREDLCAALAKMARTAA